MPHATLDLAVRLSLRAERVESARALASHLGVEQLILLIRDYELDAMIPAPGFPQTLRGGPQWRAFIAQCATPGRYSGMIDLPRDMRRTALAVAGEHIAAILIGGNPAPKEIETLQRLLPMLGVALDAEQRTRIALAEATNARNAASRAQTLSTALEAARADAAKLNAELQREHARKDDFLAMLAHELRNPLSPLVTSIELLRRHSPDAETLEYQLDVMARQINQLSRLVDDLLDVSRVSHARIDLRRQRISLRRVLEHALEASRPVLDARQHTIDVSIEARELWVDADSMRLTQVFSNLLHNAAKYTDPGGRLSITASAEKDEAVVRFRDNGVGISADMLPRVFDLFSQAPVALSRAQGGLGIGLTLVRALTELHGGRVTVESTGLGQGSTFTVRLPLAGAVPAETSTSRGAATVLSERELRVLIVDDNQDAADSLAALMAIMGHHAEVTYSALKALQIAPDLDADLMLIDIGLPELDGYELARRMRRIVRSDTRLVALTGYGSDDDRRRSLEAGFDEHVVKPVTADALDAIVASAASKN